MVDEPGTQRVRSAGAKSDLPGFALENPRQPPPQPRRTGNFCIACIWMARDGPPYSVDARHDLHFVCSCLGRIRLRLDPRDDRAPDANCTRSSKQSLYSQFDCLAYCDTSGASDAVVARRRDTGASAACGHARAPTGMGDSRRSGVSSAPNSDRPIYQLDALSCDRAGFGDLDSTPRIITGGASDSCAVGLQQGVGSLAQRFSDRSAVSDYTQGCHTPSQIRFVYLAILCGVF